MKKVLFSLFVFLLVIGSAGCATNDTEWDASFGSLFGGYDFGLGLDFGMAEADVVKVLGAPTERYESHDADQAAQLQYLDFEKPVKEGYGISSLTAFFSETGTLFYLEMILDLSSLSEEDKAAEVDTWIAAFTSAFGEPEKHLEGSGGKSVLYVNQKKDCYLILEQMGASIRMLHDMDGSPAYIEDLIQVYF